MTIPSSPACMRNASNHTSKFIMLPQTNKRFGT